MKINNEFTVGVSVDEAWSAMTDLERIAPCLPGASIDEQEGEDSYKGSMAVKIGPITAKYRGTVKFEEKDESARRAVLHATGRDARGQGTASATITSTMEEVSDGTKVSVETDMKLTGKAAQFGRGIAQDVASKMLGQFAECLEQRIGGEDSSEPAADSDGAEAAASAGVSEEASRSNGGAAAASLSSEPEAVASSFARPVGSGNGAAERPSVAASSGSGGASSSGGASEEKPKSRKISQPEPEPLDLGEMSQDAVMKRAKPVLIGAGVLFVLIWLLRRRRN